MKLREREVVEVFRVLTLRQLRQWVQRGWIVPSQSETGPLFDEVDLARIRLVCELRRDMNVNDDAVPIILELLDQLYGLRRDLRAVVTALLDQPDDVRQKLTQSLSAKSGKHGVSPR
ncbi:chaperone modulatory protein CbpM [Sinorhizobium kostiense]|uniref:Chaperone modulatory protein CbpM n=1 Tax=Sinorhizobium kostiense TaxID=76747 RepID=A0ABS4QY21_9HYPH|nr:chaperone modulator CbpM [Sinorhizobium kostiense]MBP2234467.1 chaperone modulatory protein CbpM [Sinorhizobium kostiense]